MDIDMSPVGGLIYGGGGAIAHYNYRGLFVIFASLYVGRKPEHGTLLSKYIDYSLLLCFMYGLYHSFSVCPILCTNIMFVITLILELHSKQNYQTY